MQLTLTHTHRAILTQVERVLAQHEAGNPFAGHRQLADARDDAERIYFRSHNERTSERAKVALDRLDTLL